MPDYVIVLDASSAVRIELGESVTMTAVPAATGLVSVRWFTYHSDEGFEVPVPRELWVEVTGPAGSLEEARDGFVEVARVLTPYVAFTANAAIDDPQLLLAYGRDADHRRPRFRAIPPPIEHRVLSIVAAPRRQSCRAYGGPNPWHSEHQRPHRAAVHYAEALKAWGPGTDLRTVTHLWMAIEAMTKAALRIELKLTGLDQEQLVADWGIHLRQLDGEVRSRLILHGDAPTYADAKFVSDAAEHSFASFADIHPRAAAIRDTLAAHVRLAILELAGVDASTRKMLTSGPFARPRESFPMTRLFRGRLGGEGPLAAPGQPYPWVNWTSRMKAVSKNADGSYKVTPEETMTAQLGPSVTMSDVSFELWGPRQDSARFGQAPGDTEDAEPPSEKADTASDASDRGDSGS